jgi:hypothetical protein
MISIQAQIACVERELRMRRNTYGRLVVVGTMKQETADKEIAAMEAVLLTLKSLAPAEQTLFDEE